MLSIKGYQGDRPDQLLRRAIKPLTGATGITLDELKKKTPLEFPGGSNIP